MCPSSLSIVCSYSSCSDWLIVLGPIHNWFWFYSNFEHHVYPIHDGLIHHCRNYCPRLWFYESTLVQLPGILGCSFNLPNPQHQEYEKQLASLRLAANSPQEVRLGMSWFWFQRIRFQNLYSHHFGCSPDEAWRKPWRNVLQTIAYI